MKSYLVAASILVFFAIALVPMMPGFAVHSASAAMQTPSVRAQQSENSEEMRGQAEEGIKHLLVSQVEAWNRKDLEGFMEGYWHSPDLTFFSGGNIARGWNAALQRYQQRYQSKGADMGKLEFQDLHIDLLSRQAAIVTGSWHLTMPDGKQPHGLFTLIVKKMQPGWRIVHDHTSSAEEK
jgi:beta-aspartyl-peptidase (threonine type)